MTTRERTSAWLEKIIPESSNPLYLIDRFVAKQYNEEVLHGKEKEKVEGTKGLIIASNILQRATEVSVKIMARTRGLSDYLNKEHARHAQHTYVPQRRNRFPQ